MSEHPATGSDTPILRAEDSSNTTPTATFRHSAASRLRSTRRNRSRSPVPAAAARARCCTCSAASIDRPKARSFSASSRSRSSTSTTFALTRSALSFSRSISCPRSRALENIQIPMFEAPWPPRERTERALAAHRGSRARRAGQTTFPTSSRSASASASPSRERSPTTRRLLLADEPTGNLDSKSQDEIIHLLHRLREERRLTLLIVTHSHEVAQAADRRIPMKDGLLQSSS